jgi:hypothetical protein
MSTPDPSNDNASEQKPRSLQDTLDQIEKTCVDLARVRAESKAIADLSQMLKQVAQEADDASGAHGE